MQLFQHKMRTSQHAKSVESIMTRTHSHFFDSRTAFKKMTPQGDNLTTYLRKFEINKENQNLAKRILLCESEHSRNRYQKEWLNVKRFLRVRSNFKKTLHADKPKIFKFEPILGKGKLKVDFQVHHIDLPFEFWNKKNLYRISFLLETQEIEPDQKLLPMQFMNTYQAVFYAPLMARKKQVVGRVYQVSEINCYQVATFQIDFAQTGSQNSLVFNKMGKTIGSIGFVVNTQGGLKRLTKKSVQEKENLPSLAGTHDCSRDKILYLSETDA